MKENPTFDETGTQFVPAHVPVEKGLIFTVDTLGGLVRLTLSEHQARSLFVALKKSLDPERNAELFRAE